MHPLTVALVALFTVLGAACAPKSKAVFDQGAIIRGDSGHRELALVFTGGDYADGAPHIREVLAEKGIKAGFFFTGDFYRNPAHAEIIHALVADGHYLGPHSDQHLLYAPWEKRDSSLVSGEQFKEDLAANLRAMSPFGLPNYRMQLLIPPYEWYNSQHVAWAAEMGITLFNFSPGTLSHADYTTPDMQGYRSSQTIWESIVDYEKRDPKGLNGFILLIHVGTDPRRTDKFYLRLGALIQAMRERGYAFIRIDELVQRTAGKERK